MGYCFNLRCSDKDDDIKEWIQAQDNATKSLKLLIRLQKHQFGNVDVVDQCLEGQVFGNREVAPVATPPASTLPPVVEQPTIDPVVQPAVVQPTPVAQPVQSEKPSVNSQAEDIARMMGI